MRLADAFDVAQDAHNGTTILGLRYVPNPVLGALAFGSNGAVPSYSRYAVQRPVATIVDGNNTWTFSGVNAPGRINEQYIYPTANNNNGQISQLIRPGVETITYQYDSLKRLTSAVANTWSQTYGYDGFGSLDQIGTTSYGVDANTNRLVGPGYDANGNITSINGLSLTYDVENRITQVTGPGSTCNTSTIRTTAAFSATMGSSSTGAWREVDAVGTTLKTFMYFGSRLLRVSGALGANLANITPDRLGSERGPYYPFGKEYTPTAENADKLATYHRDFSALDYADQRYSRFWSTGP